MLIPLTYFKLYATTALTASNNNDFIPLIALIPMLCFYNMVNKMQLLMIY